MDKQTQQNLLNLVKKNYEEIAEDFNETRKKYLWPEIIKLASVVKDGDRILDVGCGNGRLLEAFKDKKVEYAGVDNSEKLIRLADNKFQIPSFKFSRHSGTPPRRWQIPKSPPAPSLPTGQAGLRRAGKIQNFKFIVGDFLRLKEINEKDFNFIFCVAVLHHIPGRDLQIMALKQMKDKLAFGGKIILTVWNLWNQKKFRRLIFKNFILKLLGKNKMEAGDIIFNWKNNKGEGVSQRYYHAFRKNELKKIVKEAGLMVEKIYKDRYNYYIVIKK